MDVLKIFVSTLVVLCITAVIFFALYFLFPDLSDSVFGVSYAHGCTIDGVMERAAFKSTMDDMKSGIQDTVRDAAESVADAAGTAVSMVKDALPEAASKVKEAEPEEILQKSVETVKEAVASVDVEEIGAQLSEAEEDVVEFFSSGNGERFIDELKKESVIPEDFDIKSIADSAEGKEILSSISSFIEDNGVELVDALSNSKLHKMISGKADETLDALKGFFAGGQK